LRVQRRARPALSIARPPREPTGAGLVLLIAAGLSPIALLL
jgi:hypothetical protein